MSVNVKIVYYYLFQIELPISKLALNTAIEVAILIADFLFQIFNVSPVFLVSSGHANYNIVDTCEPGYMNMSYYGSIIKS